MNSADASTSDSREHDAEWIQVLDDADLGEGEVVGVEAVGVEAVEATEEVEA